MGVTYTLRCIQLGVSEQDVPSLDTFITAAKHFKGLKFSPDVAIQAVPRDALSQLKKAGFASGYANFVRLFSRTTGMAKIEECEFIDFTSSSSGTYTDPITVSLELLSQELRDPVQSSAKKEIMKVYALIWNYAAALVLSDWMASGILTALRVGANSGIVYPHEHVHALSQLATTSRARVTSIQEIFTLWRTLSSELSNLITDWNKANRLLKADGTKQKNLTPLSDEALTDLSAALSELGLL